VSGIVFAPDISMRRVGVACGLPAEPLGNSEEGGAMGGMLREFRQFLLRGNVIDLAVAVVIGAAFGAVVTSLVEDIITPLISAIISAPNFSNLDFTINEAVFTYGNFLNAIINF